MQLFVTLCFQSLLRFLDPAQNTREITERAIGSAKGDICTSLKVFVSDLSVSG